MQRRLKIIRSRTMQSTVYATLFVILGYIGFIIRDFLVIRDFGFSYAADTYFIALTFPMFLVNVFIVTFGEAAIPLLGRQKKSNFELNFLIKKLYIIISFILIILCITLSVSIDHFYNFVHFIGKSKDWLHPTINDDFAIIILFLSGYIILNNSIASSNNRLFTPPLLQAITQYLVIFIYLFLKSKFQILAMIISIIIGQIFNLGIIYYYNFKNGLGAWSSWRIKFLLQKNTFYKNYINLIMISFINSILIPINSLFASSLGPGSLAIFSIGIKLTSGINTLLSSVFVFVLLPYFSLIRNSFDREIFEREFFLLIFFVSIISIIISSIIFISCDLLVPILLKNISFSEFVSNQISGIMKYSFLQLPFWCFNLISMKYSCSNSKSFHIFIFLAISFIVSILLSSYFLPLANLVGLSISLSFFTILSAFLLLWFYTYSKQIKYKHSFYIHVLWIFYLILIFLVKYI